MKRIIAFIKPNMLDDVIFALHKIKDFPGGTINEVRDIGSGVHGDGSREPSRSFGFPTYIRIEIVCPGGQAEEIVTTIAREAHTGLPDDGRIIICPVENGLQISSHKTLCV